SLAGSDEHALGGKPLPEWQRGNAGDSFENRSVGPVVLRITIAARELSCEVAAELHAGVGARQRPARDAADVANSDIFDRRRLPGGKIGRLSGGDGDDAGRGTEQKALDERHLLTSSCIFGRRFSS